MSSDEVLEKVKSYVDKADEYRKNFYEEMAREKLDKAGEMLWGMFSCYISALALILKGEGYYRHSKQISFATNLAIARNDERFFRAVGYAEKLHANFYHSIITDKEEFKKIYEDILYSIGVIDGLMRGQQPKPPGNF